MLGVGAVVGCESSTILLHSLLTVRKLSGLSLEKVLMQCVALLHVYQVSIRFVLQFLDRSKGKPMELAISMGLGKDSSQMSKEMIEANSVAHNGLFSRSIDSGQAP